MTKAGHMMKIKHITETIKTLILEAGNTLQMVEIEINMIKMMEKNFKDSDRSYDRGGDRYRDNIGRFGKNRRDSICWNRGRSTSKDKSDDRRCHYCREPRHLIGESQKKKRDLGKQEGHKAQMQQTTEVAEGRWLYSWLCTM